VPLRQLPDNPSLEHLRNEAKKVRRRVVDGEPEAVALAQELHPHFDLDVFKLADAQLVVARSYGFASWPRLRAHVAGAGMTVVDRFLSLACLTYSGDDPARRVEALALLEAEPGLVRSSIHAAAAAGDVAAATELLARDPSLVSRRGGPQGWEPLLHASYSRLPGRSTLAVARLLLEHGADPNAGWIGDWGPPPFTALTGAFGYGEDAPNQPPHPDELELARLLLEAGADPNDAQTLYNNMWRKTNEHLELLFAYGLGGGRAELLEEQLRFAADAGNAERVELLIRHGVDVNGAGMNHPTLRGRSALELAIGNGHARVADVLVTVGATAAPLDPPDELLAACMRGDREAVRALLAEDEGLAAAARARDPHRIAGAVEAGRPEAVRLLVELGFDVNARHGAPTALHLAAYGGARELVDLLLELGADPSVRDRDFDATPAGWARHAHHDELADHLEALEAAAT
jgi:ankyrin repeat protein